MHLAKNIVMCVLLVVITVLLKQGAVEFELPMSDVFNLGLCTGLLYCAILNLFSILIANIVFIIKMTRCSPKEFGEFLNEMIDAEVIVEEKSDENDKDS